MANCQACSGSVQLLDMSPFELEGGKMAEMLWIFFRYSDGKIHCPSMPPVVGLDSIASNKTCTIALPPKPIGTSCKYCWKAAAVLAVTVTPCRWLMIVVGKGQHSQGLVLWQSSFNADSTAGRFSFRRILCQTSSHSVNVDRTGRDPELTALKELHGIALASRKSLGEQESANKSMRSTLGTSVPILGKCM